MVIKTNMMTHQSAKMAAIFMLGLLVTIAIVSAVNASKGHDAPVNQVSQPSDTSVTVDAATDGGYMPPDPCGLVDVVCDSEQPALKQGGHGAGLFIITAYTSEPAQTDSTPCIAADGSDICARYAAGEGICASNIFSMGVRLTVEGLGACTVADRMHPRQGAQRLDWYMGLDTPAAKTFGVKTLEVYTQE